MGQRKLKKFAQVATFSNVFQPEAGPGSGKPFAMKGRWKAGYFKNDNPITLELGCGRGEYTLALAQRFPERNFIGMDVKGARIWKGAKAALELQLANAAFVRCRIDFIEACFAAGEISDIWLPFPDPFPRKENRRLVSAVFLNRYRIITAHGASVHLKTDNKTLFDFALQVMVNERLKLKAKCVDLYNSRNTLTQDQDKLLAGIQTYYEKKYLAEGRKIYYLEFECG